MAKRGRPRKEIDYDLVYKLARIFCTQEEIASVLDIHVRTLQRNPEFRHVFEKGKEEAKISLRRMQYKKAMDGNVTMLIWLGKQYLGQLDKQKITQDLEVDQKQIPQIKIELVDANTLNQE